MAIEVKNISYTYPGSTVTAVENVSMKIEKGERVAIIGQNGAGKSTTVKLMNNIYKPTSGKIIIDGINITICLESDNIALFVLFPIAWKNIPDGI